MSRTVDRVAVVGAGRMGHGIALAYALDGNRVALYDVDEAVLRRSRDRIDAALDTLVGAGHVSSAEADAARENVVRRSELAACVRDADLVTEAVAEDLSIKRAVFEQLDAHAPDGAILATNTSGLSIDEIASPVADASRVLGTHWFNPPYVVPLVEIVKGSATADAAVETVHAALSSAEKTPVVVEKDIPGFIGNRIQAAMSYEAFSLLARGVATPQDIDRAVKAGFGFRLPVMGIFEKMDQSGLAIHHEVEKQLLPTLDRGTEPNRVITELLDRDESGMDAGKGIYDWTGVDCDETERARDRALLDLYEVYRAAAEREAPPANYDRT
jgi:3-hydroxyacyl-CoA dehydrogenase